MLNDTPIIELPFLYADYCGAVEHTELTDIDRAVASFFQTVINSLVVVDTTRRENSEFARFVARDKQSKLYAGTFESPQDFLTKLTAKTGKQVSSERNELLPVAYISRDPALTFVSDAADIDATNMGELTNEETGEVYATVNKSFVVMQYSINILAWSKETLSRIAFGLMMWTRHKKSGRPLVFQAESRIAGAPVQLNIKLSGADSVMGEPIEISLNESRLYGLTLRFDFTSEIYEAESLTMRQGRIEVGAEIMR